MTNVNQKSSSPSPMRTGSRPPTLMAIPPGIGNLCIVLLFWVLGFGIYSNTFESPFIFDDELRILDNPDIRLEKLTFQGLWEAATGKTSARSRPIGNITFALNYLFHQYEPAGYHLVNIVVHILCGILLWVFLKQTLTRVPVKTVRDHGEWIALTAALIWFVNPVQTQSVTYIVQRLNSMAAMFFLLSFVCYLNGRLTTRRRHRWIWFPAAAFSWLLALGCKQNTAMLPFFVFLYEWYFFQDLDGDWLRRNLKYVFILGVVFVIVALIFLGSKPVDRLSSISDFAQKEFTIGERVMTQFRVVIYYLSLTLLPHPSRQNLDYDFPLSLSLIDPAATLPALIGIILLIGLGIFLAQRQRLISFCIFWFLGNLVIESSVIPLAIIFEHRLYLPSMLVWLVPLIVIWRYVDVQWVVVGSSCVLLGLFSFWTYERNEVWRTAVSLWRDCVKKSPQKARTHANLGAAQKRAEMVDEARQSFYQALELDPDLPEANYNLGRILDEDGHLEQAIEYYRKALKNEPNYSAALNNLGVALLRKGNFQEPIALFNRALEINPKYAGTHNNLGLAEFNQGNIEAAIAHYRTAIELDPDLADAHLNLGIALVKQGRTEQGIHHIRKTIQLKPDYAEAHNDLGGYLLNQGQTDQAFDHLTRAVSLNPDLPQAHNNLGIILIGRGNLTDAISHFREAVRIDPDFDLAKKNLERALAIRGSMDEEIRRFRNRLAARPEDATLRFELGNLYLRTGDIGRAITEFEKCLALKPDYLEAQNNLALSYAADRQYDRALAAFRKLVDLDPDNSGTYYNIAVLHALQSNVSESVAWLETAIERGYQNWELIKSDPDLANIRDSAEYRQLVQGR